MTDNRVDEIIKLCLSLDIKASRIYSEMVSLTVNEDLKQFWHTMSSEENRHVKFWEELLFLAEQNAVPQIFDDFENISRELTSVEGRIDRLFEEMKNSDLEISGMFLIAYRMEFYLLHPAFAKLFYFAGSPAMDMISPEEEYESHLKEFIDALNVYGNCTPEMELLGETLQRLWLENRNLARQNVTDNLTGALNRRGFFDSINHLSYFAQRSGLTVGILMVDVDDFKGVNDMFGHKVGDDVLRGVAATLMKSKRASDIVGRYGGEEFIVYLSSVNPHELYKVADKIRESVKNSTYADDVRVTVSIGAASSVFKTSVEKELNELIEAADSSLLNSKNSGKDRVTVFSA